MGGVIVINGVNDQSNVIQLEIYPNHQNNTPRSKYRLIPSNRNHIKKKTVISRRIVNQYPCVCSCLYYAYKMSYNLVVNRLLCDLMTLWGNISTVGRTAG